MEMLQDLNLVGQPQGMQVVNFHPQGAHNTYKQEGEDLDAADFTTRSPFPTFHILREADLLQAGLSHKHVDAIPGKNAKRLRGVGYEECERLWKSCSSAKQRLCWYGWLERDFGRGG